MPIYEYRCESCGEVKDILHRSRREPTPVCPACGEDALKRLVSRTNFQLKGGGWYVTDYGKSGSAGGDPGAASDASSGDASSTDSGGGESLSSDTAMA